MIENHHSSNDMARCLASYMDCPQRIYDEVIAEWSASPCVTTIREYIARHQRNKLHAARAITIRESQLVMRNI